jgi:tetratricopeptide (TPR) repeat protein
MTGCKLRWALVASLTGCVITLALSAQAPTGTVAGQVYDEQGQPLAGATVVIRGDERSGLRLETETDADGEFSQPDLQPGRYHLLLLREGQILWSFPLTLPPNQERLRVEIDLKRLRDAAEARRTLDPELERQRDADRQRLERQHLLQSYYNRGARYLREEKPEEALKEFQAALELEPNPGTIHALLGAAYAAAGQADAALEAYQRALQLEPAEGAHHNNLGTLLVSAGRLQEALEHFRKAARLDPDRAASYQFNLGAALLNDGRPDEAVSPLQQAVRSDPTLAVAHFFLGVALFRTSPRQPSADGPDRVAGRPGTEAAFQRYLQLEPEGEYAAAARDYLEQLGVPASDLLLPAVPAPQDFD